MQVTHSRRVRSTAAAVCLVGLLGAAGCSSGADSRKSEDKGGEKTTAQTTEQRLGAAKQVMDKAASMHLVLTSDGVPSDAQGPIGGEGVGTHTPAFKGNLKAKLGSLQADVPVTAVKDDVYAKLPIWPDQRKIDPAQYGAPNPATFFDTAEGLSSLLPKLRQPKAAAQKRDGSDVVTPISGTLSGTDVTGVIGLGDQGATYKAVYLLTDKNEVRSMQLTGSFYNEGSTTYTLRLDEYGKKVDIQSPA